MEFLIACLACVFLTVLFVSSLYFVDSGLSRNHFSTVRTRIFATAVVCVLSFGLLYLLLLVYDGISLVTYLDLLGIRTNGIIAGTLCPCLLVMLLYTGYLVQWICERSWRQVTWKRLDLMARDYVIAPFAEEFIFRACMLVVLCSAMDKYGAIFLPPLLFGLAHMHHLMEWYRGKVAVPFSQACLNILLQVTYTSIFGLFTAFVFIRTRNLLGIVLAHSLCNVMGLPPLEDVLENSWKKVIIAAYISGIFFFVYFLFPLTDPVLFEL